MTEPTWETIAVGATLEPRALEPVTRTDLVRYQGASGDMNPIHHDEPFARNAGFPAPLAVGMFQAGAMHAWAAEHFGPENVRRASMRWKEAVFPGDLLTFTATVARKYEHEGERRIDVELTCTKETGAVAVTGTATYVVTR